jgi:hypothetical protein
VAKPQFARDSCIYIKTTGVMFLKILDYAERPSKQNISEILISHGRDCTDYCLMGYNAIVWQIFINVPKEPVFFTYSILP